MPWGLILAVSLMLLRPIEALPQAPSDPLQQQYLVCQGFREKLMSPFGVVPGEYDASHKVECEAVDQQLQAKIVPNPGDLPKPP